MDTLTSGCADIGPSFSGSHSNRSLSSPAFAGCSNSALKRMQIHGWVCSGSMLTSIIRTSDMRGSNAAGGAAERVRLQVCASWISRASQFAH